jgi:CRISPR system Cascade subunit CasE
MKGETIMSYLSQATLSVPAALKARLTDGYAWHRSIWESFPGRPAAQRDFLFRADRHDDAFRILLLSHAAPTATAILAWQTKEVPPSFLGHAVYRFQLKANPTMRRAADKRRLAIFDESRLREWMERKALAAGFEIESDSLAVGAPIAESFVKNGRIGKHVAVDYQGALRVNDRDAFTRAFHKGIGSAKGFGYGLLMLQPVC